MPGMRSSKESRLIAILLITRSRSGPKLIFHYPAVPQPPLKGRSTEYNDVDDSDAGSEEDQDGAKARNVASETPVNANGRPHIEPAVEPGHVNPSPDKLLGYSIDSLEKLLSPGRWSDRKKFEVCLDGITFLGHPVYAGENGEWSAKSLASSPTATRGHEQHRSNGSDASGQRPGFEAADITIAAPGSPARVPNDYTHMPESLDSQHTLSLGTSMDSTSTASGVPVEHMAMFHVVYVICGDEQTYTTNMYQHVAKTLSKALHHCQKESGYVSSQTRKMLALKAKAKLNGIYSSIVLEQQLVGHSELAWALKEVYEKVSVGEVAGIKLDGMEMSLHIPPDGTAGEERSLTLDGHAGLLLLEDKDVLLRDLAHSEASPLAYFIREHTATKTLQKLADKLNLSLIDALYLSQHLIKWRKARAIAPLHPRNTYIIRPDAPLEEIAELIPTYARRFAALPTLPQMLKVLSGKPIRYGLLIPSRDHRAPYMEILSFLDRYGFVARLQTFGWLLTPGDGVTGKATLHERERNRERPMSGLSLLSPHLRPVDDDDGSVTSEQTVITTLPAGDSERQHDDGIAEQALILDPGDPSREEADAMYQLIESLDDEELRERLPRLADHFDGEHALEDIAVKEGLKRATVGNWLDILQAEGCLITFRAI